MGLLLIRTATGAHPLTVSGAETARDALAGSPLPAPGSCGGVGACAGCRVQVLAGRPNPPTPNERLRLTPEALEHGHRLACQLRFEGDGELALDAPAPKPWRSLAPEEIGSPTRPPAMTGPRFGVAVDLGTTHLRVAAWDRHAGRRLGASWGPNPQAEAGADVLNRLSLAQQQPHRAEALARTVREAIASAVREWLPGEGAQLLLVGNTAMLALMTGQGGEALLRPDSWQTPIDCRPQDPVGWRAQWQALGLEPLFPPPLAGFVGSDLLASVLATGLVDGPPGSLLLDVGTNTELALWDGRTLHVTSVPGGPAFEGMGIRCGMAAEPGAIHRVTAGPEGLTCHTLGGLPAQGFCGSGLIDAVALLRANGVLKPSGRFASALEGGIHPFMPGRPDLVITPGDVDAVQRAKAALAAGMELLLVQAGLNWGELRRLCLCGAFGRHLDLGHAQAIGLLPPCEQGRIELHGNAALSGCEAALMGEHPEARFAELALRAQTSNLSYIPDWEDRYVNHLRLVPIPCPTA